jgi:hypothetical protein
MLGFEVLTFEKKLRMAACNIFEGLQSGTTYGLVLADFTKLVVMSQSRLWRIALKLAMNSIIQLNEMHIYNLKASA